MTFCDVYIWPFKAKYGIKLEWSVKRKWHFFVYLIFTDEAYLDVTIQWNFVIWYVIFVCIWSYNCVGILCQIQIISPIHLNSLRPSDAIWWHRSGSTLAQVMDCCLMAPSHYLSQCWLIISEVWCHSSEGNFKLKFTLLNLIKISQGPMS